MRAKYGFIKSIRQSWLVAAFVGTGAASLALAADPPTEQQMQRLLQSAAQAADRPDHDFAANSIQQLVDQGNALGLKKDQIEKITAIRDHYAETRSRREAAYKQSEMDALQLIHDRHSSLAAGSGGTKSRSRARQAAHGGHRRVAGSGRCVGAGAIRTVAPDARLRSGGTIIQARRQ